jgi:pSer/pThr/pTyr-binding forkhead associated (FHA) protein
MANEEYIEISFDIFEYEGQRARVKRALTVRTLIDEVLREFDDIPGDPLNKYVIYMKGSDTPLDEQKNLIELDIQPQDELVFDHFRRFLRKNLSPQEYVSFIEVNSGESFEIQWQPALIGRASQDMDHNVLLAVDLEFLPEGKTVSRTHAEVTFEHGHYYIRPMAAHNPVFLNGKEMPYNKRFEIHHRDEITLGYQKVTLFFRTQATGKKPIEIDTREEKMRVSQPVVDEPAATLIEDAASAMQLQSPVLVIEQASDPAVIDEVIQIVTYPFLLGRTHPALTKEDQASRRHAQITEDPAAGKYYITDLGSTNGTLVNGARINANTPVEIMKGSRIRLGNVLTMRFEK